MALTRITKGVIKPNENYDTHNINSTGIVTAIGLDVNGNADVSGSLSVGGVLTYEDVTSIDSIGIITARTGLVSPYADIDDFVSVGSNIHLGNAGVVTATSFVGSGAALTGIDATAIKDSGGNVKVQAQASGAMYTGIHTFSSGAEVGSNIKLGNAGVITATSFVGSGAALTGIDATAIKDSGGNVKIQAQASGAVYTGIHTFVTLKSTSGTFTGDIDVDGHTNLDNLNIAGVSTFAGTLNASTVSSTAFIASGDLDVDGHTFLDNVSIAGVSTFASAIDANGNLDVDGQTDLDVLNVSDTATFSDRVTIATHTHFNFGSNNDNYITQGSSGNTYFRTASTTFLQINNSGHLLPYADSTFDLGTSSKRFRNFYADTLYGDGANLTGISQVGGATGVDFNDNVKARFGTGNDLQLFHDGGNAHFANTTGTFKIKGNNIHLQNASGTEDYITTAANGAVELYHNGSKKFETASYGIDLKDQMIQDLNGINSGGNQFRMVVPTGTSAGFRILTHYQDGSLAFNGEIANFYNTQIQFKTDTQSRRITPEADNSYDLGSTSVRWRTIYVNDLQLSNKAKKDTGGNDVDGTWGDWTLQEGEHKIYMINNRTGKKYSLKMEQE